jgi:hypothetical protein
MKTGGFRFLEQTPMRTRLASRLAVSVLLLSAALTAAAVWRSALADVQEATTPAEHAILNALPSNSEINVPPGFELKMERKFSRENFPKDEAYLVAEWKGYNNFTLRYKTGKGTMRGYDWLDIEVILWYKERGFSAYPTREAFRSNMANSHHSSPPLVLWRAWDGIPGAVIAEYSNIVDDRTLDNVSCDSYFWRSPNCIGTIEIWYQVHGLTPGAWTWPVPFETRDAQAKAYVRPICESISRLVWSRLPQGDVGKDVAQEAAKTSVAAPVVAPPTGGDPSTGIKSNPDDPSRDGVNVNSKTAGRVDATGNPEGAGRDGTKSDPRDASEDRVPLLPDPVLPPLATGATAGLALLGGWWLLSMQQISVREAVSDFADLLRGRLQPSLGTALRVPYSDATAEQVSGRDFNGPLSEDEIHTPAPETYVATDGIRAAPRESYNKVPEYIADEPGMFQERQYGDSPESRAREAEEAKHLLEIEDLRRTRDALMPELTHAQAIYNRELETLKDAQAELLSLNERMTHCESRMNEIIADNQFIGSRLALEEEQLRNADIALQKDVQNAVLQDGATSPGGSSSDKSGVTLKGGEIAGVSPGFRTAQEAYQARTQAARDGIKTLQERASANQTEMRELEALRESDRLTQLRRAVEAQVQNVIDKGDSLKSVVDRLNEISQKLKLLRQERQGPLL